MAIVVKESELHKRFVSGFKWFCERFSVQEGWVELVGDGYLDIRVPRACAEIARMIPDMWGMRKVRLAIVDDSDDMYRFADAMGLARDMVYGKDGEYVVRIKREKRYMINFLPLEWNGHLITTRFLEDWEMSSCELLVGHVVAGESK